MRRRLLAHLAAAALSSSVRTGIAFSAPPPLDEAQQVLDTVEWEPTPIFNLREDFRRLDESDDGTFYESPRLVYHVDDAAVAATRQYYANLFEQVCAARGGKAIDVLDLGSSWVSHYPAAGSRLQYGRVAGLGMNADELAKNDILTEYVVADLNKRPELPYADGAFDVVTCTVSIDYLTKPLEVCAEVARVLRPGGTVAILFSNRVFFSKAVALWTGKDDLEHVYTVGAYLHYGGGAALSAPRAADLTPAASRRKGKGKGDPLFVVSASRTAV